jgi:hypothetical protein
MRSLRQNSLLLDALPSWWPPFHVAIVIVVVGLLVVTCGSLITRVTSQHPHRENLRVML